MTRFTYDAAGNLASLTDPVGNTTSWTYASGQWSVDSGQNGSSLTTGHQPLATPLVASETDALGNTRHFQYDTAGNLARYTDANGRVRQYDYDTAGNVTTETWYADAANADLGATLRR